MGTGGAKRLSALAMTAGFAIAACSRTQPPAPVVITHMRVTQAPAVGAVAAIVRDALSSAATEKRTLVVYVGADWCEPCQKFHRAAEGGELDTVCPSLTMLEFDLDPDVRRLAAAGYISKYVPLFALPTQDGTASGKQIEGVIKGEGAVAYIAPRLKELLAH